MNTEVQRAKHAITVTGKNQAFASLTLRTDDLTKIMNPHHTFFENTKFKTPFANTHH